MKQSPLISSIESVLKEGGRPDRGRSRKPLTPCSMYLSGHLLINCLDFEVSLDNSQIVLQRIDIDLQPPGIPLPLGRNAGTPWHPGARHTQHETKHGRQSPARTEGLPLAMWRPERNSKLSVCQLPDLTAAPRGCACLKSAVLPGHGSGRALRCQAGLSGQSSLRSQLQLPSEHLCSVLFTGPLMPVMSWPLRDR